MEDIVSPHGKGEIKLECYWGDLLDDLEGSYPFLVIAFCSL